MARRRLFRKRTTWDVLKGNTHIVVTVGALLTMLYAWSGDPTPNHPAAFQAAADTVAEGTAAPESTSSLEELLPPDSGGQQAPVAQTAQVAEAVPATPAARSLAAPAAPVQPAAQIAPPPALPIVPAVARQTLSEASPVLTPRAQPRADTTGIREDKGTPRTARGAHVRQERAQTAHRARSKPPVATAASSRPKVDKPSAKMTQRDPFSCAVRKAQPCF